MASRLSRRFGALANYSNNAAESNEVGSRKILNVNNEKAPSLAGLGAYHLDSDYLEVILNHRLDTVGAILIARHILVRTVEIFDRHLETGRKVTEDITKDILTLLVLAG